METPVDHITNHSSSCIDCGTQMGTEAHSFTDSEPTWAWSTDHMFAQATFTCPCGRKNAVNATVEKNEYYYYKNIYTATVVMEGKTYTKTYEERVAPESITAIPYVKASYVPGESDETDGEVVLSDATAESFTFLSDSDTEWRRNTTYVLLDDLTIDDEITVNGNVNLILGDELVLTAKKGINVGVGGRLNIYGQTSGTDKLIVNAVSGETQQNGADAINGSVIVHGGVIEATGANAEIYGTDYDQAVKGYNGGAGFSGNIIVFGGSIKLTGGNGGRGSDNSLQTRSGDGGDGGVYGRYSNPGPGENGKKGAMISGPVIKIWGHPTFNEELFTEVAYKAPTRTEVGNIQYYQVTNGSAYTMENKIYTYVGDVVLRKLELVHVAAYDPSCTSDGCIEHWYDAYYDKYFSDENGEHEIAEEIAILPATGHTFNEPFSWNWSEDLSSATASAVCSSCHNTVTFGAEVTVIEEDEHIIRTASFEYKNTVYADVKNGFVDSVGARVIGHTLSLNGEIGINFYMELADDIAASDTAYMRFEIPRTGDPDIQTVLIKDARKVNTETGTYYVFKCQVAAKEMTSVIKAQIIDGDKSGNTYTYSVKEYADYLLAHADADGSNQEKEYAKASGLVKSMLNYGAYSQLYFDKNPDTLANADLSANDMELGDVTVEIADPVLDTLPEGVTFMGASLSLRSATTLSLYFISDSSLTFSCDDYTIETVQNGIYQTARIRGIPALCIGDIVTLKVNGAEVKYSPLNYVKNALTNDEASEKLVNVAKALYRYWQAADAYFSSSHMPEESIVDLSKLTGNYQLQDGDVLTGTLPDDSDIMITVADGATVKLRDADITSLLESAHYAGITLLGDATILLEGSNDILGANEYYPGIYVPVNHTLTIDGTGSLEVSSNGLGCGIGGGYRISAGNIVINGGNINAEGDEKAAGTVTILSNAVHSNALTAIMKRRTAIS